MTTVLTRGEIVACVFDVGVDILATTLDPATGTITAQLGDVARGVADNNSAEVWQGACGVLSRPALADAGKASCQAVTLKTGSYDVCIGYRDLRATEIYGNLAPGETCLYATTGMARELLKKDGSARQFTTDDNTRTGNSITAGVSSYYQGIDGQKHLGGEWRYSAPWGGAWHDPSGYHLRTYHGNKIDIGGLVLPAPVSASVRTMAYETDFFTVKAASVVFGSPAAAEPLVKALSLQALMGAYAGEVSAFTTALDGFLAALSAYAAAIAGIADPTNVATPALALGIAGMVAASDAFATATATTMATLRVAAGTRAVGGS